VFGDSTVEENLRLGGYRRSHREVRAGLDEAWGLFPALLPLRRRKAGMLSGGEKEMVAIGMALVARPQLLLLDEPLLGLSPRIQAEVVRAIGEIGRRGTAVLIAEQYARPVLPIVDRATVIENGSEVLTGSGRELLDHPEVRAAYFGV
jgi:branched-chain amino acid transport system ATP-binding protein